MIEAVEHFNPAKEVRLSTYAVWRIRKKLSRAVKEKGKTIRIPIYVYEQYNELSSKRNELEITTLNDMYLKNSLLTSEILGEGFTWFDTGTNDSMMEASNLIRGVQKNQDRVICAPEAIAYENGWIDKNKLLDAAELIRMIMVSI